jgi:hypothetical protein
MKRYVSNNTSQTAKKSAKPVPTSAAVKLLPEAVLTRIFFAPLRTTDMDTEVPGAENTLAEQETDRERGRLPPIMMISTTNLIRLQSELKDHVKGEYEFRNTPNGTRTITKEMADYSSMKFYLEKINIHYFILSPNSGKRTKGDTPAEYISSSLEDLGFKIIKVRQMTALEEHPTDNPTWNPSLNSFVVCGAAIAH